MCVYDLTQIPNDVIMLPKDVEPTAGSIHWRSKYPIPKIGDRVTINFNQLGDGVVESYFVEHGWFGLSTRLVNAPDWHRRQHPVDSKHHNKALVFGSEITI